MALYMSDACGVCQSTVIMSTTFPITATECAFLHKRGNLGAETYTNDRMLDLSLSNTLRSLRGLLEYEKLIFGDTAFQQYLFIGNTPRREMILCFDVPEKEPRDEL